MKLDPLSISVPLIGMNQKAPKSSGPLGRIETLTNAQAKKTHQGQLRVQKRDGMSSQSLAVRDVKTGALLSSGGVANPSLAHPVGETIFEVGSDSVPYVQGSSGWERWPNTVLTNTMRRTSVYAQQTQVERPDMAVVGSVACYALVKPTGTTGINGTQIFFKDLATGTLLAAPLSYQSLGSHPRIKVVADGTRFWVFINSPSATAIAVNVYDTSGVLIATSSVDTLVGTGYPWDVAYDSSVGVVFARGLAPGCRVSLLTISGSTITVAGTNNAALPNTVNMGLGFLRPAGDGFVYLATFGYSGVMTMFVSRMTSAAVVDHQYNILLSGADDTAVGWCNVTGHVVAGSSHDIYVVATRLASVAAVKQAPDKVITFAWKSLYTDVGFATLIGTQRSVGLASRAFAAFNPPGTPVIGVGSRPVVALYYPSVQSTTTNQFSQTTFFLWDYTQTLGDGTTPAPQICGRFEYGQAACDWPWTNWDGTQANPLPEWFCLSSPTIETNGDFHLALAYRSTSFTILQTGSTASGPITGTGAVGVIDRPVYVFTGAIGIVDEKFSSAATAFDYAGELLLPGPLPMSFGGTDIAEVNFCLAPEAPTISTSHSTGLLTPSSLYTWVGVWESTTPSGLRIRSAPCTPTSWTTGPSDNTALLTFPTLRVGPRASTAILSAYRTAIIDGVMSTNHYKVTNDLSPVANSTTADTVAFSDEVSDAACAVGEQLYTDGVNPPFSYRYPPPPHNGGCVIGNLVVVMGYDNAVWASYEKVEGEALSFAATRRIPMPTDDPLERIEPMDGRLVAYCKRSQWVLDNSWPDAAGNGSLPTPIELPFTNGCTGVALPTQDGIVYASDQGGFWLTGRDLTNHYIGGPVEDDTAALGVPFAGCVDDQQRCHFLMSTGLDLVYDGIVDCWYRFQLPSGFAVMMSTKAGKMAFMDGTKTWVTVPGQATDDAAAIITTVKLAPMAFASVPGLNMVWDLQFYGTREGRHTLTVTLLYDDETTGSDVTVFDSNALAIDFAGGQAYRWDIQPRNPECQAIAVQLVDSFPNGATLGFTLENIGAETGIIPGTRKIAISQRPLPG